MHRFLASLIILGASCTLNVHAQEICWADKAGMPATGITERAFILAGTSENRNAWAETYQHHYRQRRPGLDLTRVMQTLGKQGALPTISQYSRHVTCDSEYQGSILIRQVRRLGPDHPYIPRLAENQLRALSNCTRPKKEGNVVLPERNWSDLFEEADENAQLAEDDYAYLTGVSYFNRWQYEEARQAFSKVGKDTTSPHREAGQLMEVRSLRKLGDTDEAYALAEEYRINADDFWKIALDEQEDIIAQHSLSTDYAADHLEKVYRRVSGLPIENEPAGFRIQQAIDDFDLYFMNEFARLAKKDVAQLPHDWWLSKTRPKGSRAFIAVHALASKYDGIDWVQAYHSSVAYERDNTWFSGSDIRTDTAAYKRVTEHAYAKWKAGSPRWAIIVAKRMTPDSRYIPEMEAYARKLQEKAESCSLTPVEFVIYARVTHHLVRALAVSGQYDKAQKIWSALYRNQLYPQGEVAIHTQTAFSKLLMIREEDGLLGELEDIRLGLSPSRYTARGRVNPGALWTVDTPDKLLEKYPDKYMSMLNQLPADIITTALAPPEDKPKLRYENRSKAAEVLWMRGFVFGDEDLMARTKPLLIRSHPGLKRYFRQADAAKTPEARDFAFAVMVLRNPGLTPYFDDVRNTRTLRLDKLDPSNPLQGNWWCAAEDRAHLAGNEDRLRDNFFDFAFRPSRYPIGLEKERIRHTGFWPKTEKHQIDQAWQRFRNDYPPFDIISEDAQTELETLPRASEWLATKVRAYLESPEGQEDLKAPRDERIPESLHRLVEATRYSCHTLKRGNASTSRWAYKMLHVHYGDTTWAAETPYWFDTLRN